ncbi:MAG: TIGR03618 family F420-dependent PPOX class oxidoreductase [Acidimicrobiia bacterium]|nr:TIGR03618 family F420-dependent PPOX class oxidoreductase [Acidimicrobiia bacterium]
MPSRRDKIRMTEAEVDEFLSGRHTMNIATFGPDGTIHLVAMWYGFLDGAPVFETYARSQKVKNLRRNPNITALVETGEDYDELRGVELVGKGEIIEDHDRLHEAARSVVQRYYPIDDPAELDAAATALMAKRVAVRIDVERTVSWDHRKLAAH